MNSKLNDTLSKISGLPTDDVAQIVDKVLANNRQLESCPRHRFVRVEGEPNPFRQKYRCEVCGGSIGSQQHHWWLRGLSDGRIA